jgi:hypothetical protein
MIHGHTLLSAARPADTTTPPQHFHFDGVTTYTKLTNTQFSTRDFIYIYALTQIFNLLFKLDWLHPDVLAIQFIGLNNTGFRLAHQ